MRRLPAWYFDGRRIEFEKDAINTLSEYLRSLPYDDLVRIGLREMLCYETLAKRELGMNHEAQMKFRCMVQDGMLKAESFQNDII